jgi:O-antigen ligase/tetratricopeptide (TPR) repeat protein
MKKPTKPRGAAVTAEPTEPIHHVLGRVLLFVHLMLSPLIFSASTVEVFEYNKVAILTMTAIAVLAGAAALHASYWIREAPPPSEPLAQRALRILREPTALGFVLFLASSLVSSLPGISINPRTSLYGAHESFAGIFTMASYIVLFFATRALCRDVKTARVLLFATVIAVAVASIYGVMQLTGLDPIRWGRTSQSGGITRVFATMGHPNFYSAFLLIGFPIVAYYALRAFREGLWFLGAALSATAILDAGMVLISISRGAWVGFLAMFAILAAGWYFLAGEKKVVAWFVGVNLAGLVLCVLVLSTFEDGRAVLDSIRLRWANFTNTGVLTHEARRYIWESSIQMLKDHPLFGIGLDGFQLAFEHYRTVAYWNVEWNGTPTKAHNEILHILAMQGLFGGLAMLTITAGVGLSFLRAILRRVPDRPLLVAIFAGAVGFYVQDVVSFTVAGCGTLFVTYAALLSRLGGPETEDDRAPPRARQVSVETSLIAFAAQAAIAVAAVVAISMMVITPFQANAYCRTGASLLGYEPTESVRLLQLAVRTDPTKELYWVRLGTANQLAARTARDPVQKRAFYDEARKAYERSIELVPENSYNEANLGRLLGEIAKEQPPMMRDAKRPDGTPVVVPITKLDAYAAFDRALKLDPNNAYFYADGANAALSFRDMALAKQWASKCVELYPDFGPCISQLGYIALDEAQFQPQPPPGGAKRIDAPNVPQAGQPNAPQDGQQHTEPQSVTPPSLIEQAIEYLTRSITADWHGDESGRVIAESNLAAALIKQGRFAEALRYADDALARMPDYQDARFNKGKADEMLGKLGEAHAEYARILETHPDHHMAREHLKMLRQKMRDLGVSLPAIPDAVKKAIGEEVPAPPPLQPLAPPQ